MAHGQGRAFSATAERDRADQFEAGQQDRATVKDRATGQRATCVVIRHDAVGGEQGLTETTGVSRDTVGAKALCMRLVMLPPGTRGTPHSHNGYESAIWVAMGEAEIWHGPVAGAQGTAQVSEGGKDLLVGGVIR